VFERSHHAAVSTTQTLGVHHTNPRCPPHKPLVSTTQTLGVHNTNPLGSAGGSTQMGAALGACLLLGRFGRSHVDRKEQPSPKRGMPSGSVAPAGSVVWGRMTQRGERSGTRNPGWESRPELPDPPVDLLQGRSCFNVPWDPGLSSTRMSFAVSGSDWLMLSVVYSSLGR